MIVVEVFPAQSFISGAGDADLYLIMCRTGGAGVSTGQSSLPPPLTATASCRCQGYLLLPGGEEYPRTELWSQGEEGESLRGHTRALARCTSSATVLQVGWNSQPTRMVILEECRVPLESLLGVEGQVSH